MGDTRAPSDEDCLVAVDSEDHEGEWLRMVACPVPHCDAIWGETYKRFSSHLAAEHGPEDVGLSSDGRRVATDGGTSSGDTEQRDDLVYGGICPVCGEKFIDGYDDLEEGESYEARICVDEIDGEGEGKMLVHLTGDEDDEKTPQQEWEEHNEQFQYEPPQKPAEAWPSEAFTELWDRTIRRDTQWVCQKCSKQLRSLGRARRHVEKQHSDRLIEQAESKIDNTGEEDDEAETDGGQKLDENQTTLVDADRSLQPDTDRDGGDEA